LKKKFRGKLQGPATDNSAKTSLHACTTGDTVLKMTKTTLSSLA